jgi:uncharacterized secreted protein with C-terminal beta-propeller domain
MRKKSYIFFVLSILILLSLGGCSLPWKKKAPNNLISPNNLAQEDDNEQNPPTTSQIKKFINYEELAAFLKENNASQNLSLTRINKELLLSDTAVVYESASDSADSSSLDYSTTNNQVAGVDEADIIRTDGEYIYALVRQELKIIKASPAAEAEVVSVIKFESRPQGLFIGENSLAVFGNDEEIMTREAYKSFRRHNPYSFFKVFDLTDIANPKLVRDLNFEGSYTDARLIGDYAYLFTSSAANYLDNEQITPRVLASGQVLSTDCSAGASCYAPDIYYFDIPYESYNFTNVTAINIKDNNEVLSGQSYLMSHGQNLYVSEKNIYITYTEYLNEYEFEQSARQEVIFPKLSPDDQTKINEIEKVATYILSKNEKKIKIALIIDRYFDSLSEEEQKTLSAEIDETLKAKLMAGDKDMEKTVIHKIGIRGSSVEYRGLGTVNGRVLNQFSMDEYDTYFRIATTRSQLWSRFSDTNKKSYNNVYILNNELKLIGGLENLALDEVIYSARFMGDRVYLVTFKQTDPLYAISLADPLKPSVLGSIKIPGYSTYLHPADQDGTKLIGIGRDAEVDSEGNVKIKGLKLSLFDFTDLKAPKELDSFIIGDATSDSIALYDHKAFLYSADKNLITLPAVLRDNNKITFAGSLVFNLNNDKLVLKGNIDHSEGGKNSQPDPWNSFSYYDNTVKRSLYINDNLYTFSNKFLKINKLEDLSVLNSLILTEGDEDIIVPAPVVDLPLVIDEEIPAVQEPAPIVEAPLTNSSIEGNSADLSSEEALPVSETSTPIEATSTLETEIPAALGV